MWGDLLLQLGGTAASLIPGIGPVAAPLITGGLQGLASAFGISDGGSSATQLPLDKAAAVQQAASYTSTGAEGAAANREAAEAARRFIGQQTAEGRFAAQTSRALGSQALGAAQQTTDLARSAAMMNLGNQNRNLMQQAAAAGGSPAALAGVASNLGQANTQTLNALAQQGTQAQQSAIGQASQAFSQAEQIRGADLAQQRSNFEPFALQKNAGTTLGQLGQYQQTSQQIKAAEDPWTTLKALGGQAAVQRMQEPYEDKAAARGAAMGTNKDLTTIAFLKQRFGIT